MRLIDADKMIKDLTERYEDNLGRDVILKLIGEQPEAYSVEKVVEALEKEIKPIIGLYTAETPMMERAGYKMEYNKAIKKAMQIVKAGGQHEVYQRKVHGVEQRKEVVDYQRRVKP